MEQQKGNIPDKQDEISMKDILLKIRSGIRYVKSKRLIIITITILGGVLGIGYSIFKKPNYVATSTFVLDEASKGRMSQYSGLASLAGIDLPGSTTSGLFEGDNILELYKSRLMIEKALLSEGNFNGKNELLIDRYADYYKLREHWKEKDNLDNITFTGDPEKFNRKQDSIITDLVELFNKNHLSVIRPDKKLNIIRVDVTTKDELFSKAFNDKLVDNVNNFYILTRTKKASQDVLVLQRQADSVKQVLNASISGVASAIDAAPNANPLLLSLKVPSQKKQVDVQASTAIYSEIVKNLEISKMNLRQETPLIQVIDHPVLPLYIDKVGKLKGTVVGLVLGFILSVVFVVVRKLLSTPMV